MLSRLHINPRAVRSGGAARVAGALLALSAGLLLSGLALAADRRGGADDLFVSEGPAPTRVTVIVNKSRTFTVGRSFARAIVGSVDFADVLPLSDRAIYIQGKRPGTTNVSILT